MVLDNNQDNNNQDYKIIGCSFQFAHVTVYSSHQFYEIPWAQKFAISLRNDS